jgi:hypothetical protein
VLEDERTCVFRFPEPDGLVMGKFRGFHIASPSLAHARIRLPTGVSSLMKGGGELRR